MKKTVAAMVGALALAGACKEPLSAPSEDAIVAGSAQPVQNLVTGVVAQDRAAAGAFSYLLYPEGLARNALRPDPNEPRFVSELIAVPSDPSAFIGGSGFNGYYTTIRAANQLLSSPTYAALSAGDKNATLGLVQTIKAISYLRLLQLRDSLGASIQTEQSTVPDPLRTKAAVLTFVSALLDSAYTSLTAGGVSATVPVAVPSGYKLNGDFSLTSNLAKYNRGLKGETEVYRLLDHQSPCQACAATAITALNLATAGLGATPTAAQLAFGPYNEFNPSAPESFATPIADIRIYLTDNFVQSIQAGDLRSSKIVKASGPSVTSGGLSQALTFKSPLTEPTNQTRPIPVRRAALWYLLRAQAEAASGNLAGAAVDVSAVRTAEGGLPAVAGFATMADAQAAILYDYRYSFLFEGPYYLVALREYSALTKAYVSLPGMPTIKTDPNHASDPLQTTLPIPQGEATARKGDVTPKP